MRSRFGQYHCGSVRIGCEGEPTKVSMCCCIDCQRRTGSAFSVAVFFKREQVSINGETRTYTRPSASNFPVTFHFCPACGSNLFWRPDRLPDRIGVAIGAFADPTFQCPDQAVWTKSRHTWLGLPVGMPCYEENPPYRPPLSQAL